MDMSIVECDLFKDEHQEAFLNLLNEYIKDDMGGGAIIDGPRKEKLFKDLAGNSSKLILFSKKGEVYAGMVVCFFGYSTFRAAPLLNVHDIIVLPGYRRDGIGRRLMGAVEAKALAAGCVKVTLEVRFDNEKARHLYMTSGYGECHPPMSFWTKPLFPEGVFS
jgi:ribosomal protein S18 acetylase RimI-like enzyme